jgi:hypothetical protein
LAGDDPDANKNQQRNGEQDHQALGDRHSFSSLLQGAAKASSRRPHDLRRLE